jgi:Leucine-rich repeat (LRR) protein/GTPase SAR1 family protein
MEKALLLIKDCLKRKLPALNLAKCGLYDEDLSDSRVGDELAKCTHLTKLILSNYQYTWQLHRPPVLLPDEDYKYRVRGRYWEDRKVGPGINYFQEPDFKPIIVAGSGLDNQLSEIPAVIQNLVNLQELVCGGDNYNKWKIQNLLPLQSLRQLKILILNHNSIEEIEDLHLFPHLEKLDLSNNNIKQLLKIEAHNRLKALDLSGNKLKKISEITQFPSLEWLSLSRNALQDMDGLQGNNSLRVLDLSRNFIPGYKSNKKNPALAILNLSNNLLFDLPDLKNTPNLQYLFAGYNKISNIVGLKALKSLQVLDLSNNMLDRIPTEINSLEELTILDLSNNNIHVLNHISGLQKLKVLNADSNFITDVKCEAILPALKVLLLNNNRLSDLNVLSSFPALKRLYAADNHIEKIVTGKHLPLSVVVLCNNNIIELPFLSTCRNLIYLDLSNNCLQVLEQKIFYRKLFILLAEGNQLSGAFTFDNYPRLTHLNLSNNNIRRIGGMKNFRYLKTVRLQFNVIEYIFTWSNMPVLSYLGFQNNRIKEIADNLKFLPNLKELDATGNQITIVPNLLLFPKLEKLNLSNNRISEIGNIDSYPALQELYLMQNHILVINDITKLFQFRIFNLSFNPINRAQELLRLFKKNQELEVTYKEDRTLEVTLNDKRLLLNAPYFDVPQQIPNNDSQGIKDWLIARGQGGFINLEVRCILFGNGETGKTALSHYLRVDEFYAINNRTHGILIESWEVNRGDWPEEFTEAVLDSVVLKELDMENLDMSNIFTFNIWDFGGQEFYHATHRLFMSTDVLYLVMWEKEIDFQDEEKGNFPKEYWIKNIQHYAAGSSILLVQNRADQQFYVEKDTCYKIGVYDEKNPQRVSQFKLDIGALKEGIFKSVSKLPHFAMYTPKIYHLIKSFFKDLKRPYITFSDYESICEHLDDTPEQIMSEPSQRESLIKYLDNIGSVVCFRHRDRMNDPLMKDYIFTNAKWLTTVIYEILEKGVNEFDYEHVERIVSQYQLSPEVWIKVMQNFGLIFEVKSKQGNKYVAPQYLPSKCKNERVLEFALACKKMHCVFTISYPLFMPNSNFLRLISNYGSEHVNFLYWKNGLVFFKEEKTVFIECVNTVSERKVKVHVQDNDQLVAAEIFDCIVEIDPNDSMEVSVDQENYVPLSVLNKKVKGNRIEVDASNGETLSTRDFKFLFKNRHGGKAIHQKKITVRICILYRSQDEVLQELLVKGLTAHLKNKPDFDFEVWIDNNIDIGEGQWNANMKERILKCDVALLFVSAGFALSYYNVKDKINESVKKEKKDRFLVLPVLIRSYEYAFFESLIKAPFFKTYYGEYGNTLPFFRDRIMPFDVLAENDKTEDLHLNNYYKNLADTLYKAVSDKFSGNA